MESPLKLVHPRYLRLGLLNQNPQLSLLLIRSLSLILKNQKILRKLLQRSPLKRRLVKKKRRSSLQLLQKKSQQRSLQKRPLKLNLKKIRSLLRKRKIRRLTKSLQLPLSLQQKRRKPSLKN